MLTSPSARPASTDVSFFSGRNAKSVASTSTVVVTTRLTHKKRPNLLQTPNYSDSAASTTPPSTKRKPAVLDSLPRDVKRLRPSPPQSNVQRKKRAPSAASSRSSSRQQTPSLLPEPIYRSSRSRSTSMFPQVDISICRKWSIEEDGIPGPNFLSSEDVVKALVRSYKSYFKNPDDLEDRSFDPINFPVVELEYPNGGATERYLLLAPKDKDHYNPIMDLEKSLYAIIECYLTPAQQALFGAIPTDILSDISPPASPSPSPPHSRSSNSSSSSSLTTLSSLTTHSATSSQPPRVNYLRAIQRAIHRQDGPLFVKTLNKINSLLRSLKYPPLPMDPFVPSPTNILREAVSSWTSAGLPKKVLMRIIDETYQRSVGPHVGKLKNYEAFSSEVYGELMPSFIADVITATGVNQNSLFLDLGSGVGNVVVQASLQSGCKSFGVELMPAPAKVGREQLEQIKIRCRMWGVAMGEVELEEGDFLCSQRLTQLLPKADVVLVNNKVFLESLNEALRPRFLDLKEGAIVVSLKPFVSSLNARVTERNLDDISAIFDVTERAYHSGSVSWGSGGGSYYMHRVDRDGYARIRQQFENSRTTSGRVNRPRR